MVRNDALRIEWQDGGRYRIVVPSQACFWGTLAVGGIWWHEIRLGFWNPFVFELEHTETENCIEWSSEKRTLIVNCKHSAFQLELFAGTEWLNGVPVSPPSDSRLAIITARDFNQAQIRHHQNLSNQLDCYIRSTDLRNMIAAFLIPL